MNISTLCDKIELQLYMKKRVNSNIMIPRSQSRVFSCKHEKHDLLTLVSCYRMKQVK